MGGFVYGRGADRRECKVEDAAPMVQPAEDFGARRKLTVPSGDAEGGAERFRANRPATQVARRRAEERRSVRCEAVDGCGFRLDAVPGVPGNNPAKRARIAAGRFVVERKADGGLVQVQLFGPLRETDWPAYWRDTGGGKLKTVEE
jgi:hypothetical protein